MGGVPGAEGSSVTCCVLIEWIDWLDDLKALPVLTFGSVILILKPQRSWTCPSPFGDLSFSICEIRKLDLLTYRDFSS